MPAAQEAGYVQRCQQSQEYLGHGSALKKGRFEKSGFLRFVRSTNSTVHNEKHMPDKTCHGLVLC
jgi:hypothetical protein